MANVNKDKTNRDFEKPVRELEKRIEELEAFSGKTGVDLSGEIDKLRDKSREETKAIFRSLSPWQRILLSRDSGRPGINDYIATIFDDFMELHGDRAVGDDPAMATGLCRIGGIRVMLVGQRKGSTTKERVACNFGSPHPEGYRKAIEKMKLAEKFKIPIVSLVNTPGAYPGIGAEERGQAFIIAKNLFDMSLLRTPILSIVIGEGGSGGALGICVADKLMILQNAYLSVISPEGCAAILWRDATKAPAAAELLRLMPQDLERMGIIDEIIPEPLGGAHKDPAKMGETLKATIVRALDELTAIPTDQLIEQRYDKYRKIGYFLETEQQKLVASGKHTILSPS